MNLLKETIQLLDKNNYTSSDILLIGSGCYQCSWEEYQLIADFDYDDDCGGREVARDLKIYFRDGAIAFRDEYDGSEWWSLLEAPPIPGNKVIPITKLKGSETLAEIHEEE